MMKKQSKLAQALMLTLALLAAQGSSAQSEAQQLSWPAPESIWLETGTFVNVDNLRQVMPGMSKDQLYDLLGRPHFNTGLFGVHEWNYMFNFRTGRGQEYVSCQYKVLFDGSYLVRNTYWRDPGCARFLEKPAPVVQQVMVPAPPPPPPPPPLPRRVTLGADGLFRFAGGTLGDLLPDGRNRIEALVAEIQRSARTVRSITVSGHTDRIGSLNDNMQLSMQRAQTVRDLMAQRGIAMNTIRVAGFGPQQPLVQCPGTKTTPELIACLQPNRRVEIEFNAE